MSQHWIILCQLFIDPLLIIINVLINYLDEVLEYAASCKVPIIVLDDFNINLLSSETVYKVVFMTECTYMGAKMQMTFQNESRNI